eukprot:9481067-Pyramimonas_sp.AAC.1
MLPSGPLVALCGPYIRPSWPPVVHALTGPIDALRGPTAALSGPLAALCGPYIHPSRPPVARVLSGSIAALSGPSAA